MSDIVTVKPLFDRFLADGDDTEANYLNEAETIKSIQKEIQMLLNTRCSVSQEAYERLQSYAENHPTLYGMKEWPSLQNKETQIKFLEELQKLIMRFEPRLRKVSIKVSRFEDQRQKMLLSISGTITVGDVKKRTVFPLEVRV